MSVRRPDNPNNRAVKCYLLRPNQQAKLFYAREEVLKNITNPMGDLMPDGERHLVTSSDLDFQMNDYVRVATEKQTLTIEEVIAEIDSISNNGLRGNPRYQKRLLVK